MLPCNVIVQRHPGGSVEVSATLIKIGVWRAISIQKTRHLDSIVAHALLVVDFIDSIGQKLTQSRLVG